MTAPWTWRRLLSIRDDHRRISAAAVAVASFILISRAAGAAREVAIAHRYGATPSIDAYVFVFNLVGWPVAVWTGVLMTVVTPALVAIRNRPEDVRRFREELLGLTLWLGSAAGLLCFLVLRRGVSGGVFALAPQVASAALFAAPSLSILVPVNFLAAMYFIFLLASQRHVGSLLEAVPPIVAMLAILLFPGHGLVPLLFGVVGGTALQVCLSAGSQADRRGVWRMRFSFDSPAWRLCRRGVWIVLLGQVMASSVSVVDQLAAARLGAAANANLGYANRLIALATALGATVVARALLPVLCELQTHDPARAGKVTRRWGLLVFAASMAGVMVAWLAAEVGVRLMFQHGAFTAEDTRRVASVLRAGLWQLPPYLTGMVAVQLLTSRMKYAVLVFSGASNLVAKIVFNALFIPLFGLNGVMFSTAGMYLISAIVLWGAAFRRTGGARA